MLIAAGCAALAPAQQGPPPATVAVASVEERSVSGSESFVGTITPIRKSTVGSAWGGRVTAVQVDAGDPVGFTAESSAFEAGPLGQPLVQLRTATLDVEIAAAEVTLRQRELEHQELQASLPNQLTRARAVVAENQARADYAQANYERLDGLSKQGTGLSQREVQEAFSLFRSQSELLAASAADLALLEQTQEIRLARSAAAVENQRAELQRLAEMRENYTIRAPFEGYVTAKLVEVGQWVAPGDPVVELVQLDPIELVVNLPQAHFVRLQAMLRQPGSDPALRQAVVTVESADTLFEGEIVTFIPQADLRSRAFPVRIRLANPRTDAGHLLQPGMLARASLALGEATQELMVPKDALVLGPRIQVFVVREEPQTGMTTVQSVEVETGASLDDWIAVRGLLAAGDRVVTEGNERLVPGQPVSVLPASPPADAGPAAQ